MNIPDAPETPTMGEVSVRRSRRGWEKAQWGCVGDGAGSIDTASLPRPSLSPTTQPAAAPPATSPFAASLSRLALVDTSPPPFLGGDAPSDAGVSVGAVLPAPPALDATGASIQGWPLADGGGSGVGGGGASGSGTAEAAALPPPPPRRTSTLNVRGAPSILLPHQRSELVSHIAIDIGGSLIKLVYFSGGGADRPSTAGGFDRPSTAGGAAPSPPRRASGRGGKLHFVKFETAKIDDCLAFIEAKGLHRPAGGDGVSAATSARVRFVATGGGAFRFADLFASRLGVTLEKEDEMECLVAGADFLLRAIQHEAFTYLDGAVRYSDPPPSTLHPYLLVNIGSGVSMLRVDGGGAFARVSGSSLGGGTFWGLVRLLTGVRSFDDMLDLCSRGDNTAVDMLVGDIYGRDRDYSAIGLTANTIASSFGRAAAADADLSSYAPADVAMAVCRMISYNIGHLAYLNAKRYGLSRVFFGGFFIRGHPYTMATISYAIRFWSGGEMEAHFLRHEGFLGAVGAFLKVHPMSTVAGGAGAAVAAAVAAGGAGPSARRPPTVPAPVHAAATAATTAPPPSSSPDAAAAAAAAAAAKGDRKVRARFVERFSMGAPYAGGVVEGDPFGGVADKVSWVEQHVDGDDGEDGEGDAAAAAVAAAAAAAASAEPLLSDPPLPDADDDAHHPAFDARSPRASMEGTPLAPLAGAPSSSPRAAARLGLHVGVLHYSPGVEPFPLLADAARYAPDTLDAAAEPSELAYWVGVLADQVPQVVAKAVASEGGTPDATRRGAALGRALTAHFARLRADPAAVYGGLALSDVFELREECLREFGFVDVYARDKARETVAALGELPPLLSELDEFPPPQRLEAAVQGALAANIFDWGARACVDLYAAHGDTLSVFRDARDRAARRPWRVDSFDQLSADWSAAITAGRPPFARTIIFVDNAGADVVLGVLPLARELLRTGGDVILAANTLPALNDVTEAELRALMADVARADPILGAAAAAGPAAEASAGGRIPPPPGLRARVPSSGRLVDMVAGMGSGATSPGGPTPGTSPLASAAAAHAAALTAAASTSTTAPRPPSPSRTPRLFVVGNGQGSPCLDLRRVPDAVADAAVGADFVVLIGMGRAVHTNFSARFRCASLKLALVKNAHLARRLFGGDIMDCVCLYEKGVG